MNLYLMFTITNRRKFADFMDFYKENKIEVGNISYGRGTATYDVLDYLGLEDDEKTIFTSVVTDSTWKSLKQGLKDELEIDVPGTGVCFTVPLSSIGGKRELSYLIDGQDYKKGKETTMKETNNELIIAITNYGHNAEVMDVAKKAGAKGGTMLHGRGLGLKDAQKFLGVSLVSEKEIILIVSTKEDKNKIMQAIIDETGVESKAGTICFSLPVSDVAGIKTNKD